MQPPPLLTPLYEFKGIMSQVWQRWFQLIAGPRFVDRGDPADYDFSLANFTTDGTWRDLSLASIVPEGAKSVLLMVIAVDNAVYSVLKFRKNGVSNAYNVGFISTQVADYPITADMVIALDSGRIIEYFATNTVWTTIYVVVKGWWL